MAAFWAPNGCRTADHHDRRSRPRSRSSGEPRSVRHPAGHCAGNKVGLSDEIGDEQRRRHVIDGLPACRTVQPTLVVRDAIGHGKRFVVIVRDEDRCGLRAAQQVMQFLAHPSGHIRIKVAERLVEQGAKSGMLHQRPSESHPLLLTAGQLMRVATSKPSRPTRTDVSCTRIARSGSTGTAEGNVLLNTRWERNPSP